MIYDKKSVRAFIMNYEPPKEELPLHEENINNFFSLDKPTTSIETSDNFEEHIFFNELSSVMKTLVQIKSSLFSIYSLMVGLMRR